MSVANIEKAESLLGDIKLKKISQGAEAIIFLANEHPYSNERNCPTIVKYRPRKLYRYPVLDLQIVKQRTASESRIIFKLFQSSVIEFNKLEKKKNSEKIDRSLVNYVINNGGVNCPKLIGLDVYNGFIFMDYINDTLVNGESSSLKNHLWLLEKTFADSLSEKLTVHNCQSIVASREIEREVVALNSKIKDLLVLTGIQLGNMHMFDVIHGDLTSSNIILKKYDSENNNDELQPLYIPYLIDFGLSSQSSLTEDKAVDLYVLEKALESTHPLFSKDYSKWVLEGYELAYEMKGKRENAAKPYRVKHREIYKRLEAVRLRGRKRSMIG
ncbi:serine/threonine protein kinase [Saccharomycopsis crataegensis]|uniref:EKC/KEOPS complex subunit BUD32 n=1 Tax=Saccharomycopsis crataegensis TaxID=43959 RepID=A0AAV5QGQ5_9ASCO|nr:serine/threonine protein kinase [Saccharomycopsis crataegensis]